MDTYLLIGGPELFVKWPKDHKILTLCVNCIDCSEIVAHSYGFILQISMVWVLHACQVSAIHSATMRI